MTRTSSTRTVNMTRTSSLTDQRDTPSLVAAVVGKDDSSQVNDPNEVVTRQAGWGAAYKEKGGGRERAHRGWCREEGRGGREQNVLCLPGACDSLGGK